MWNFENKYAEALGTRYSRIIASFRNVGGSFEPILEKVEGKDHTYKIRSSPFEDWLRSLPLTEEDVKNILEMEQCGKFELEQNADKFLHPETAKSGRYPWNEAKKEAEIE